MTSVLDTESVVLSHTGKHWNVPHTVSDEPAHITLEKIARSRGIVTDERMGLIPPSIFTDMDRATKRIRNAISAGETIAIFGDYDCDGITGVAQLVRYFTRQGVTPLVRLPHRIRDGYGLNTNIVAEFQEKGVSLVITCDTGITAVAETAVLMENGIDVIITDHHHAREELPPAFAIIHPALCAHPTPHPSGSGVAFKLIVALENGSWDDQETDIALAMIGTVGDLVPLQGDNRALVIAGLRALNDIHTGPLASLQERCGFADKTVSSTDIAFRIAPRINAAGRMDTPDIALEALLKGGDALEALDMLNARRQEHTAQLLSNIVAKPDDRHFLVHADASFPHGLLGLLAGKLTETSGKPSLVATIDGEYCTASLRSPACYDIAEALERIGHLLLRFGGHAQAAGCTFATTNLSAIEQALNEDINTRVSAEQLVPSLTADAPLLTRDITPQLIKHISALEPFGQGNQEPKFFLRNVTMTATRTVGGDGAHLQGMIDGIQCIGFNLGIFADRCQNIDIIAKISMNTWNGKSRPQIMIEDMRATF